MIDNFGRKLTMNIEKYTQNAQSVLIAGCEEGGSTRRAALWNSERPNKIQYKK